MGFRGLASGFAVCAVLYDRSCLNAAQEMKQGASFSKATVNPSLSVFPLRAHAPIPVETSSAPPGSQSVALLAAQS